MFVTFFIWIFVTPFYLSLNQSDEEFCPKHQTRNYKVDLSKKDGKPWQGFITVETSDGLSGDVCSSSGLTLKEAHVFCRSAGFPKGL